MIIIAVKDTHRKQTASTGHHERSLRHSALARRTAPARANISEKGEQTERNPTGTCHSVDVSETCPMKKLVPA